ncbi:MAG: trypsin-like serine peptidase [Planctomycetota bacterium]|jgi:hypothetical protein
MVITGRGAPAGAAAVLVSIAMAVGIVMGCDPPKPPADTPGATASPARDAPASEADAKGPEAGVAGADAAEAGPPIGDRGDGRGESAEPTLAAPAVAPAAAREGAGPSPQEQFACAGAWRGRKKQGGTGIGAATLVAPSWAITAAHVASKKARDPGAVDVAVRFGGVVVARVEAAHACPDADIALVKLEKPVEGARPVALLSVPLTRAHGSFPFTFVSRGHGLKVVPGRTGKGNGKRIFHSRDAEGKRPGKAGDSGGAWLFDLPRPGRDVQFAVIHGGGFGPQPAAHREWIEKTMAGSGQKVTWAPLPDLDELRARAGLPAAGEAGEGGEGGD